MHISLTPELESKVKEKVRFGYYNNASEVIREALRYMDKNEQLLEYLKLERLRYEVKKGAIQAESGEFSRRSVKDIINSQEALLEPSD
jgi:antitoxin ParD1/3/4